MPQTEQPISEGLKWIDVTNPTPEEVILLANTYQLNRHIVEDCLQPEHLPKYEFVDDINFMILRYYACKEDCVISNIQELTNKIAIFYSESFIVTIHKMEVPFIETIRRSIRKYASASGLVSKIVWFALETFDERVNQLSQKIDVSENEVMMRRTSTNQMEELYLVKREAALSLKVLLLMQEPANHIKPQAGEESMVQDVKDQHLKMITLYGQVLEEVNNLMNLAMSFSAQKTNEVVKVLTIFSVFFMPLTFIVGIYGMNFEFMPELSKKWGYPAVLVLMIIVTGFIYIWFKRKKWL
ncbi:MAG: CorA family divalent cation transporter [Bacteroidota bacterium]